MLHIHLDERTITYHAVDFWWCAGMLHKHRSIEAAERCESSTAANIERARRKRYALEHEEVT